MKVVLVCAQNCRAFVFLLQFFQNETASTKLINIYLHTNVLATSFSSIYLSCAVKKLKKVNMASGKVWTL